MGETTTAVTRAESGADGIEIVRVFDAPRELVFRAWTEPDRFAQWFGDRDSTMPVESVQMDVRPGGTWRATMLVGDHVIPWAGEYVEVDPPAKLVLTVTDDPAAPQREVLTVLLADLGEGRTEMTFTQRGGNLPAEEYARAMRGELIFFERLAEHLAA
jgi:uncharacterized protein YndB with AHSA1/START domain